MFTKHLLNISLSTQSSISAHSFFNESLTTALLLGAILISVYTIWAQEA